ncbi:hypothetical protein ACHQM5_009019 [Ranunculus cassubicifolius]
MDVQVLPRKISSTRSLSPAFLTIYSKERYSKSSRGNNQASTSNPQASAPFLDWWKPDNATRPSLSDIIWPSAGAFATMAVLGKMDEVLAPTGLSITIAPVGAACAVLFVTPNAPAARIYNIFVGEICCAIIAVLVFAVLGPGWLARSTSLSACIAFMIYTCSVHPPAASLPIMFIDGPKLHELSFWYALFPGAAGSVILFLIQQMVRYMKVNYKF